MLFALASTLRIGKKAEGAWFQLSRGLWLYSVYAYTQKKMSTRQKRKRKGCAASSANWKRGFRVKEWKAFLFRSRANVARCFHWKIHFHERELKETLGLFVSSTAFSFSFFVSFFIPLACFYSTRAVRPFFNGGLPEHTNLCPWKQKSRNGFSRREIALRLARFPPIMLLTSFRARRIFRRESPSKQFHLTQRTKTDVTTSKSWSRFAVRLWFSSVSNWRCNEQWNACIMLHCFRDFAFETFFYEREPNRATFAKVSFYILWT